MLRSWGIGLGRPGLGAKDEWDCLESAVIIITITFVSAISSRRRSMSNLNRGDARIAVVRTVKVIDKLGGSWF